MEKNELALSIGDILNKAVREKKGRLTEVSEQCSINRQKFDPEDIIHIQFHQLVRLGQAIALSMPRDRYEQMKSEISDKFWKSIDDILNGDYDDEPTEL